MGKRVHVRDDSRLVREGDIFVAIAGEKLDGHDYIDEAIKNGAKTIYYQEGEEKAGAIFHKVADTRLQLAEECKKSYSPLPQNMVAVTGTSGKTSVAEFTRQLWELLEIRSASVGTLGVRCDWVDGEKLTGGNALTSMPTVPMYRVLEKLARNGINHVVMEASSHGLSQQRLHGLRFNGAAFTNLSRDHLDYHKDMEAYFQAKAILFKELLKDGARIIAKKDEVYYPRLQEIATSKNLILHELGARNINEVMDNVSHAVRLVELKESLTGMDKLGDFFGIGFKIKTALIGRFQAENLLTAASLVYFSSMNTGITKGMIMEALPRVKGVAGRMQQVPCEFGQVIVDYAHKPEALRLALEVLRNYTDGKLICVFGCGGNRDKGKRALMGEISRELSDIIIITDDNPRWESSASIRSDIISGIKGGGGSGGSGGSYIEIADRAAAIEMGLELLKQHEGSTLLIAGKGHESGQIIGNKTLPFDDVLVAESLIEKIK